MQKIKTAKIIEQKSLNTFVIELQEEDELETVNQIKVQHDYVEFIGNTMLFTDWEKCPLIEGHSTANAISFRNFVQIPIYGFYKFVLPFLNKHKYLQPEHVLQLLKDSNGNDIEGRFNYNYCNTIFKFYDSEKKQYMYAVQLEGESEHSIVTSEFYNTFVVPILTNNESNNKKISS